jgi:competence protein ComGC
MLIRKFTDNLGESFITPRRSRFVETKARKAVSMLEVLTIIVIITILIAIMIPALRKARQRTFAIQCMDNQRQIVIALSAFASDNNGEYPESVATIGLLNKNWNWQEPTMLISCQPCSPKRNRSLSAYLYSYIKDASVISCPSAPRKYPLLQQAWDAGDSWDNPDTFSPQDPLIGTYCFFWNYTGFLVERKAPFKGPKGISYWPDRSNLLVCDYFGFGHWRNMLIYGDYKAYGSCERFKTASITPGTPVSSAFWSRLADNENVNFRSLDIELHAAYVDGHVDRFSPSQTIIMKVSQTPDGSVPYPDYPSPGDFYLPEKAFR